MVCYVNFLPATSPNIMDRLPARRIALIHQLHSRCCLRCSTCEWLPHVDKLTIDMLVNCTPPTCLRLLANIFIVLRVLHSNLNIVRELPSIQHIKSMRTVLSTITKTFAAYRLGRATYRKQLHADEKSRRQVSIVNVVIWPSRTPGPMAWLWC